MASRRITTRLAVVGACLALGPLCQAALAHAVLLSSTPADGSSVRAAPQSVSLRFSEAVTLLQGDDATVVDERGRTVSSRARVAPRNTRLVQVPLTGNVGRGSYTVRYRLLSADAHVITGLFVFAVGGAALSGPVAGGGAGPSETSVWAISARFLELIGLGGLFGLIAFRWLVWRPAVTATRTDRYTDRETAAGWMRDTYWLAFAVLALGSLAAEVYLLLTKSASLLGTSVPAALGDASGVIRTLSDSRFGALLQLRSILLLILFTAGIAMTSWESSPKRSATRQPGGSPLPTAIMAAAAIAAVATISTQGHASTAPAPLLSMGADTIHLLGAALWIVGLAFTLVTLLRLPRVAPDAGPSLAAATLARFSRVALVAVTAIVITGVMRSVAQLSDPAQLWETSYGRSILIKLALLAPVGALALRNRRIVTALTPRRRVNRRTARMVGRGARAELALAVLILIVASVLVAQVPGRAGA